MKSRRALDINAPKVKTCQWPTHWEGSYNTVRYWSGRSGWRGLWHQWRPGCCPSPQSESLPPMKGRWRFFYKVTRKGTLSGFHLPDTEGQRSAGDLPVRRPPRQDFPGLLGADSTVRRVLGIFTVCAGSLKGEQVGFGQIDDTPLNDSQRSDCAEAIDWRQFGLTWAACTCGDWITEDCADWITPWTWNWPPGSCTTATEELPSDICHTKTNQDLSKCIEQN